MPVAGDNPMPGRRKPSARPEQLPALERRDQLVVDLRHAHLRLLDPGRVVGVEVGAAEQRGQLLLLELERLDARRQASSSRCSL